MEEEREEAILTSIKTLTEAEVDLISATATAKLTMAHAVMAQVSSEAMVIKVHLQSPRPQVPKAL